MITVNELHRVCNKYNFFTEGTNEQYSKLFDTVREDAQDIGKIALIIWVCSEQSYKDIYNTLVNEFC